MTQVSYPCSSAEHTPWWETVSTKELAASADLVAGLLNPVRGPAGSDATVLARAVVIQRLFMQETLLSGMLAEANEQVIKYSQGHAASDLTEANAWLKHCALLEEVFRQSIEMLGNDAQQVGRALFAQFTVLVDLLRGHLVAVEVSRGIGRDVPVPPPASFRRRGSA